MIRLLAVAAETYVASPLHGEDRIWPETNCYADLWIEVLHALDLEPRAALPFTLSVDFEGDQWQFFKFPLEDLRAVYGLDVAEMNPWRGVEHHVAEQLAMGRLLTVEVDSWYLPDTAGVSYQREHVKSSIVPNLIDRESRRLEYFHNRGYHRLEGDDYAGVFRLGPMRDDVLPPYVELVKLDHVHDPGPAELTRRSLELVVEHAGRRPSTNPVQRFRKRFEHDLAWLSGEDLATFHAYAFATLRQFGACCELSAALFAWLADRAEPVVDAVEHFTALASGAKAVQFKLARLATGRQVDVAPLLEEMEERWEAAFSVVGDRYG